MNLREGLKAGSASSASVSQFKQTSLCGLSADWDPVLTNFLSYDCFLSVWSVTPDYPKAQKSQLMLFLMFML